jgi:hypothetical protein
MLSDDYIRFFLESKATVVQFETIEISHPAFSRVYRAVRNHSSGLTAKLETGEQVFFEYYPLRIQQNNTEDNLDYTLKLHFGDLGDVLPTELDRVQAADGFRTKPVFKYRIFRSDYLEGPMFGPVILEIVDFGFNKEGATFDAKAPMLNLHRTGAVFSISRFPMLRGFL